MGRQPASGLAAALFIALLSACASSEAPPPAPVQIGSLVRPGVPLELARHRSETISDVAYDLALDLTGPEWVNGAVSILFRRAPAAGHLVLDFRGLSVTELFANQRRVRDAAWINEHIVVPEEYLVEGENTIDVRFMSAVGPSGASVIRFVETPEGAGAGEVGPDTYHYSLLVPADASQLFPSFDQPDLKAVIRLELIAPPGSRVLANAPVVDQVETETGVWTRFEPTVPISTYLAAFAAGPWTTWSDSSGTVPMTLYARRSRAAEVDADSLLATNRRALRWLEEYFDFDYPFGKFDFLLAPGFPFGGMEHPGAVFYNESRFIFREPPTLPQRLARDATIYHEVAHQWFGDLVTMRWFDDLWLKEGFATYMAARMQDALNPGTGAWKTFYLQNKPQAYRVDVTTGTTPVWQSLANLDQAKGNYGPIVYNKAPAILKQLNFMIGEEAFRAALRRLLRRHAYGNFSWQELLTEMQQTSGMPLREFGEQYILRRGAPIVQTRLVTRGGVIEELSLIQRPAVEPADSATGGWPGRVQVRLGYAGGEDVAIPVTFTGDSTVVEGARGRPAPDYVFPNDADYGYGIFLLDEHSADYLIAQVGGLDDSLLRTLVWGALWDGVRAGQLAPQAFVRAALRELAAEADEQIAVFLLSRTATALRRYVPAEGSADGGPLRVEFERFLVRGIDDATASYDIRKGRLDVLLSVARSDEALAVVRDLLAGRRSFAGAPLPQPTRWDAVRTLLAMGVPEADSVFRAERLRDSGPEGDREAFIAGAARRSATAKEEYFRRYLSDASLNEEWVTASLDAFNHPEHDELTRPYLAEALERLPWIRDNRRIFFLPRWIDAFVDGQTSRAALATIDEHLATETELSQDIRRKILQARDELARSIEIREGAAG